MHTRAIQCNMTSPWFLSPTLDQPMQLFGYADQCCCFTGRLSSDATKLLAMPPERCAFGVAHSHAIWKTPLYSTQVNKQRTAAGKVTVTADLTLKLRRVFADSHGAKSAPEAENRCVSTYVPRPHVVIRNANRFHGPLGGCTMCRSADQQPAGRILFPSALWLYAFRPGRATARDDYGVACEWSRSLLPRWYWWPRAYMQSLEEYIQ